MNTHRNIAPAALAMIAALGMTACKPAAAKGAPAAGAAAAAPVAGALTVQPQADLGPENQAMPRFAGGDAAATAKINLAMSKLDASTKEGLTSCPDQPHGGQSQTVKVARNGPDFVVVQVTYESDCGAYPSSGTNDFFFDAKTGDLVDWSKLIPDAAATYAFHDEDLYSNAFNSAPLQARVVAAGKKETDPDFLKDCLPVLEEGELSFTVNLDDEKGVLDVTPDLPHVVQACADSLRLTPADLTALHADPRLVALVGQK